MTRANEAVAGGCHRCRHQPAARAGFCLTRAHIAFILLASPDHSRQDSALGEEKSNLFPTLFAGVAPGMTAHLILPEILEAD